MTESITVRIITAKYWCCLKDNTANRCLLLKVLDDRKDTDLII